MKLICLIFSICWSFSVMCQSAWSITDDYKIEFSGKGASGTIQGLSGSIVFDPDDLHASRFDVSINPATIDTGNNTKNKHARGSSWLNVEEFTHIGFTGTRVEKTATGYFTQGTLVLHGVSRLAQIDFTFKPLEESRAVFEGTLTVNREDYGIEGPLVSFMVGDEFEVAISVVTTK